MLLAVQNVWTRVQQATQAELDWLWSYLSFDDVDHARRERARAKAQAAGVPLAPTDDRIRLLRLTQRVFPTGLLPLVRQGAPKAGWTVDEVDTRPPLPQLALGQLDDLALQPWGLRDYQLASIRAALQGTGRPGEDPGRGILWVPTGGGKGRLAVALGALIPGHVLFCVHRSHLAADIGGRWSELVGDGPAGTIGDGRWSPGPRFTVASLQTLYSRLGTPELAELADRTTAVVVDECHVLPADTFTKVAQALVKARVRIGLSGTPLARGDKRSLIAVGALGPVVYRVRAQELVTAGVLARPTVRLVPCYQRAPRGANSWAEVYRALVTDSAHRGGAVLATVVRAEAPGIVYVQSISHGSRLARDLQARGLSAEFVSGKASLDQRQRAVRRLTTGVLDWVVATTVFNEGVDIPALRSVVIAAGGKSGIAAIQRAGRALRVTGTKTEATIWDIADRGDRWLERHAKERLAAYQREEYPVVVDQGVWPEHA